MPEDSHLSLKIPVETHKKLKVISALSEKSITSLIIEWVDQQNPDISGLFGSKKKLLKSRKSDNAEVQQSVNGTKLEGKELEKKLIAMKAEGLSYPAMSEKLNAEGYVTSTSIAWSDRNIGKQFRMFEDRAAVQTSYS